MWVGSRHPFARRAGGSRGELGLRGYDAVHLASVLALDSDTTRDLAHLALLAADLDSGEEHG